MVLTLVAIGLLSFGLLGAPHVRRRPAAARDELLHGREHGHRPPHRDADVLLNPPSGATAAASATRSRASSRPRARSARRWPSSPCARRSTAASRTTRTPWRGGFSSRRKWTRAARCPIRASTKGTPATLRLTFAPGASTALIRGSDMDRVPQRALARLVHRFRERRVDVDRAGDVLQHRAHLEIGGELAGQLADVRSDRLEPQHPMV